MPGPAMTQRMTDPGIVQIRVGYFGKVPTQGDFVSRGLPRSVESAFDGWLRASIRESQRDLGQDWLDAFLVAPVWRMALGPGVADADPVAGVMMPSVDRVGRYFPLVIAASLPGLRPDFANLTASRAFFDALENLALSTLSQDFALADFEASMEKLNAKAVRTAPDKALNGPARSVWWTGPVPQDAITVDGLPDPARFAALFLERKNPRPAVVPEALADHEPTNPPQDSPRVLLSADCASAALKGTRSPALTDVTVMTPGRQALSLLSGIGHHPGMPAALQGAAAALSAVENLYSMNDLMADAKGKLGTANALLRARGIPGGQVFAASVVTLLVQAQRYAVLWAGNARAYLLRHGTLSALTRDHAELRLPGLLTRAIGAAPNYSADTAIGQVQPGDRFLLCSPGLFQTLTEAEIAETLALDATADRIVTRLTQDALIAGAAADVSAIAVLIGART